MNKPYNVVTNLLDIYWDDPCAFAEDMLGFTAEPYQQSVLNDLAHHPLVTVRSGQGVGKTGMEAVACIWFLTCRPNARVVCTAPTRQQLNDVLWAEIAKWLESSKVKRLLKWTKTKITMIGHEKRWFATARTATKPENMQGFHEEYMLFIADEASGIDDKIMEAILGTLSGSENKLLMCGNPTRTSGTFYDSHHKDRVDYRTHKISSRDSTRTNKTNIAMLERKYGADSDVVRVRVDGEFPKAEPDVFIPLEFAEQAAMNDVYPADEQGNPIIPATAELHIGADIARFGNDESVIVPRIGKLVPKLLRYTKQETTKTAGEIIRVAMDCMSQYKRSSCVVKIDDDGVGGGVTDNVRETVHVRRLPIQVVACHNGAVPKDDEHYDNWGAEVWATIKELLQDKEIQIPNDEDLIGQLSTRKYSITPKGKIRLERKEDMKKRGLRSPDRADALSLAFAPVGVSTNKTVKTTARKPVTSGLRHKRF